MLPSVVVPVKVAVPLFLADILTAPDEYVPSTLTILLLEDCQSNFFIFALSGVIVTDTYFVEPLVKYISDCATSIFLHL